jgi:hypothetical protein
MIDINIKENDNGRDKMGKTEAYSDFFSRC